MHGVPALRLGQRDIVSVDGYVARLKFRKTAEVIFQRRLAATHIVVAEHRDNPDAGLAQRLGFTVKSPPIGGVATHVNQIASDEHEIGFIGGNLPH